MKKTLFSFTICIGLAHGVMGQNQSGKACAGSCCASTASAKEISALTTMKTTTSSNSLHLSCKLTTPELQERKKTVITSLRRQVLEKKELANGYAYKFESSDTMLDELTTFIQTERMCCDFFSFNLKIQPDKFIWMELTGPKGAKEFITTEIEL